MHKVVEQTNAEIQKKKKSWIFTYLV